MIKLAAGWTLAIALALAAVSIGRAQGPDVQIVQLECTADPELVVIENRGDAAQTLTGWELQSDPPDSEVFDLTVLGGLQAGASVFIQSGPSASGVFNWGLEFVFRDDDLTDYARIVDDTGAVVHQVNCGEVAPQPSPTPSPEPSPTPSPEPSPPNDVPNGGGPPPPPGDALLAAMMILVGGSMAAAGVATGAFSWLRLRPSLLAVARPHAQRRAPDSSRGEPISAALGLALVGLAAAVVFRLLRHRSQ